ncbi:YfjI family protein [Pseudomonas qingdaonensis]|uniref:YfjI family protein n=1 Tax=Pseudomonas qingdaonensis TaxID=2056231 RepID=UPI00334079A1
MNASSKYINWKDRGNFGGFKFNDYAAKYKRDIPLELSLLDDIVKEIVDATSTPPELTESALLGAMSIACQHLIDVDCPGGGRSPTSLFLLASAESGERKSSVETLIFQPIFDIDHKNRIQAEIDNQSYECKMIVWKAGVNRIRRELNAIEDDPMLKADIETRLAVELKSKPTIKSAHRFIYRDESIRNLQIGLATNWPSAALVVSESTGLFSSRSAESLPSLSAIWDGRPIDVGRATTKALYVPSPRLTISLMLQPRMLRGYLGKQNGIARISGLLARFWVVEPVSTQGYRLIHPSEIDEVKKYKSIKLFHQRLIKHLENSTKIACEQRKVVRYSTPAKQIWLELFNTVESELAPGGKLADIKDCASKIGNTMSRIAALIHFCLGRPGDIDVETALYARALSLKSLNNFKKIFGVKSEEQTRFENAMRLNEYLNNKVNIMMNGDYFGVAKSYNGIIYFEKSQLENSGPLRPKALLDEALGQLVTRGVVSLDTYQQKKVVCFNRLMAAQLGHQDEV